MSSLTEKYQINLCPEEFQERLTDIGGVNPYDEPNFLLVWSQGGGEHSTYRAGGAWNIEGLPSFKGYRDLLVGGGVPCWALFSGIHHQSLEPQRCTIFKISMRRLSYRL